MRESTVETLMGAVVLLAAILFLWFGLSSGGETGGGSRYQVLARFNNASGIERGTEVRVAGIKKGIVREIGFDGERYEAKLTLALDQDVALPDDSDARIVSDGLLGGAYIAIEPGGGFDMIARDGSGEILYTRGAVDLLTLFASMTQGGQTADQQGGEN